MIVGVAGDLVAACDAGREIGKSAQRTGRRLSVRLAEDCIERPGYSFRLEDSTARFQRGTWKIIEGD